MPTLQPKNHVERNCPACGGKHMGGERGPLKCVATPTQPGTIIRSSAPTGFNAGPSSFRMTGTFAHNGFRGGAKDA